MIFHYLALRSQKQGLNNVVHDTPQVDSAGLHRKQDPGAGAFTYFHNIVSEASVAIPAGSGKILKVWHAWTLN